MGIFTWKFSDDRRRKLKYGGRGYIALPDGSFIEETYYDGLGMFGGYDAYDVVADLNRPYLKQIMERLEKEGKADFFVKSMKAVAVAYAEGTKEELEEAIRETARRHGNFLLTDWKRNIGIAIACDDSHNAILPYPLKITSTDHPPVPYAELGISSSTQ